jgi:hypothetical protein
MKKWRKWQHEVRRVAEVLGAPFIGREMEGRGREAGGQAAAGGAPLTRQLREEETTGWPFDEREKKRRRRRVGSLAQRVAWVLDAVATTGIGFGGDGIGREVGDEARFDWAKLGRAAW